MSKKKRSKDKSSKQQLGESKVSYMAFEQNPSYPSEGLTPATLSNILKSAAAGDMYLWAQLCEDMEEKDPALLSVLEQRKGAVSGLGWKVNPASESELDIMIADHCANVLRYIPNFSGVIFDLLDSIGKGYSVCEMIWEFSDDQLWIKQIIHVLPQKFTFVKDGIIEQKPRLIDMENQTISHELTFGNFLCHQHRAKSGLPTRNGLLRTLCYFYLFKNFDIKSWIIYLERFGHPLRVGKYGTGATDEDKRVLKNALVSLATDSAAIMSKDTEIEFVRLEAAKEGASMFLNFIKELVDSYYSKVVLGHSSANDSTPGKLGNENTASELRQDLLESDAKSIEELITTQLLAAIVEFQFGTQYDVPSFKLLYEAEEDLKELASTVKELSDAGLKSIPLKWMHEKFNIPMPAEGEKTLADLLIATPANSAPLSFTALSQDSALIEERLDSELSHDGLIDKIRELLNECSDLGEFADNLPTLAGQLNVPVEKLSDALALAFLAGYAGGVDG